MRTLLFALCLIILAGCKHSKEHQHQDHHNHYEGETVYYLIRHAEKDRSDPENKDPELTEAGQARALVWASYFEDKILDAIYSSDYARTRQTATPTAQSKRMELTIYEPRKLYSEAFLEKTEKKSILIVGHSNTIPDLVNKLIKEDRFQDIEDNDNSSLFIVRMHQGSVEVERTAIDLP